LVLVHVELLLISNVQLNGIKKILPIGELNEYEKGLLKSAIPELQESITKVGRHYDSVTASMTESPFQGAIFISTSNSRLACSSVLL